MAQSTIIPITAEAKRYYDAAVDLAVATDTLDRLKDDDPVAELHPGVHEARAVMVADYLARFRAAREAFLGGGEPRELHRPVDVTDAIEAVDL